MGMGTNGTRRPRGRWDNIDDGDVGAQGSRLTVLTRLELLTPREAQIPTAAATGTANATHVAGRCSGSATSALRGVFAPSGTGGSRTATRSANRLGHSTPTLSRQVEELAREGGGEEGEVSARVLKMGRLVAGLL